MPKTDLSIHDCVRILEQEDCGYLAMCLNDRPYCIPVNYYFERTASRIYIHTGLKGVKWEYLSQNPRVCFTVSVPGRKKTGESPCQYTYEFESVMVFGSATAVESEDEISLYLIRLINKYREGTVTDVPEDKLAKLRMIRIDIEKITGRQNL